MMLQHARLLGIGSTALCLLVIQGCTSTPVPVITPTINSTSIEGPQQTSTPDQSQTPTVILTVIPPTSTPSVTPHPIVSLLPTATPTPSLVPDDVGTPADIASDPPLAPVVKNEDWMPVEREFDGVAMALVPIGCFMMGGEAGTVKSLPIHEQCIEQPFWIDKYEISNEQFARFLGRESTYKPPWKDPLHPHEGATWTKANEVCEARGARLPTEKEWEYAARGPSSWLYPWGNEWNKDNGVWRETQLDAPTYVWMLDASQSWVGAYHMAGNVAEWTSSKYLDYPYSDSNTDNRAPDSTDPYPEHVIRGLARVEIPMLFLRMSDGAIPSMQDIGFRCVHEFG